MKATKLEIVYNETRRYITIRGDGDLSTNDAGAFAIKAMNNFGLGESWCYVECEKIEHNEVVVVFERRL